MDSEAEISEGRNSDWLDVNARSSDDNFGETTDGGEEDGQVNSD